MDFSKNNKYKLVKNNSACNYSKTNFNKTDNTTYQKIPSQNQTRYFPANKTFSLNNTNVSKNISNKSNRTVNNALSVSLNTSNNLDELLKRCNQIGTSSVKSNEKSTAIFKNEFESFNGNCVQAKLSLKNPLSPQINPNQSQYKLNKSPSNPQIFKINHNSLGSKQSYHSSKQVELENLDSNKYKVNNVSPNVITTIKQRRVSIVKSNFKLVRKAANSTKKKKISADTKKLLAMRRSKFFKSQNRHLLQKNNVFITRNRLINRNKITKSLKKSISSYITNFKGNKYKLINSKETYLNNKYIKYGRRLPSFPSKNKAVNNPFSFNKIYLACNLVHKSIITINKSHSTSVNNKKLVNNIVTKSQTKKHSPSKLANGYCLFYNRFGRCARGEKCPKIHDPKRIALCPRFLRGTCKLENCPFSHTISAEKTPLCSYFAKGCCNRENCSYSHVYNGKEALICMRFARDGFCPLGSKCNRAHINQCIEFLETNKCSKGSECPFMHYEKKSNKQRNSKLTLKRKSSSRKLTKTKSQIVENESSNFGDSFIKFHRSNNESISETVPVITSNININNTGESINNTSSVNHSEKKDETQPIVLKTRPSFGLKKKAI